MVQDKCRRLGYCRRLTDSVWIACIVQPVAGSVLSFGFADLASGGNEPGKAVVGDDIHGQVFHVLRLERFFPA